MKTLIRSLFVILFVVSLSGCRKVLPDMDLHVHLTYAAQALDNRVEQAYEKADSLSQALGVTFGIAEEIGTNSISVNDSLILERIALAREKSLYLALQVSRRDWQTIFSKEVLDQVDYILADAMIFPNKEGRTIAIWIAGMPLGEPEEFMDLYVAHTLKILAEPIDVWANPTYLPDTLVARYDELWTEERMKTVIDAAVKNNIAIEINSRFMVPNAKFIKMAKKSGAVFTFGTNQHGQGVGDIEWSKKIAEECRLTGDDFFIPERKLTLN